MFKFNLVEKYKITLNKVVANTLGLPNLTTKWEPIIDQIVLDLNQAKENGFIELRAWNKIQKPLSEAYVSGFKQIYKEPGLKAKLKKFSADNKEALSKGRSNIEESKAAKEKAHQEWFKKKDTETGWHEFYDKHRAFENELSVVLIDDIRSYNLASLDEEGVQKLVAMFEKFWKIKYPKDLYQPLLDHIEGWAKIFTQNEEAEELTASPKDIAKKKEYKSHVATSKDDVEKLDSVLKEITANKRDEMINYFTEYDLAKIEELSAILKKSNWEEQKEKAWKAKYPDGYKRVNMYDKKPQNPFSAEWGEVLNLWFNTIAKKDRYSKTEPEHHEVKKDYKNLVKQRNTDYVDSVIASFIHKNQEKLLKIIVGKKNLKDITATKVQFSNGKLETYMSFSFDDGSKFDVQNQIVYGHSNLGTPFARFPTTFHDVVLADKKKMGSPSEQRMYSVFLGLEK